MTDQAEIERVVAELLAMPDKDNHKLIQTLKKTQSRIRKDEQKMIVTQNTALQKRMSTFSNPNAEGSTFMKVYEKKVKKIKDSL